MFMDTRVIKQDSNRHAVSTFTLDGMIKCNNMYSVTILLTNTLSDYRKYIAQSVHS